MQTCLDHRWVAGGACVDLVNAVVVAVNEESSLCVVSCQEVKKIAGPLCWSIVEGQRNNTLLIATADLSSVWDTAYLGPWDVAQSWSWWDDALALRDRGEVVLMRCLVEGISVSEVGDRLCSVGVSGMVFECKDWSDEGQDLEKVETHFDG